MQNVQNGKQAARALALTPRQFSDSRSVVSTITKGIAEAKAKLGAGGASPMAVFHWNEEFASGLIRTLTADNGVVATQLVKTVDEAMRALQRGVPGLVIWYDGEHPAPGQLLEHVTEARRMPWTPSLVLVPGPGALTHLAKNQGSVFFDAVANFDRKKKALEPALASMLEAPQKTDSPRALLERLRQQFKGLKNSAEKPLTLDEATKIATQLATKPGKRYWAISALALHMIGQKKFAEAQQVVDAMAKERPQAFNTLVIRQVVAAAMPDGKQAAAKELAAATLKYPELTANRLFRIGETLDRWKTHDALADLLDGWQAREDLRDDHQLAFLAGRYYKLAGDNEKALAFFATAAVQEPTRIEYLTALATSYSEQQIHDRCSEVCRLILQSGEDEAIWLMLVNALMGNRQQRDAKDELAKFLAKFPASKDAQKLKSKLDG